MEMLQKPGEQKKSWVSLVSFFMAAYAIRGGFRQKSFPSTPSPAKRSQLRNPIPPPLELHLAFPGSLHRTGACIGLWAVFCNLGFAPTLQCAVASGRCWKPCVP